MDKKLQLVLDIAIREGYNFNIQNKNGFDHEGFMRFVKKH